MIFKLVYATLITEVGQRKLISKKDLKKETDMFGQIVGQIIPPELQYPASSHAASLHLVCLHLPSTSVRTVSI